MDEKIETGRYLFTSSLLNEVVRNYEYSVKSIISKNLIGNNVEGREAVVMSVELLLSTSVDRLRESRKKYLMSGRCREKQPSFRRKKTNNERNIEELRTKNEIKKERIK